MTAEIMASPPGGKLPATSANHGDKANERFFAFFTDTISVAERADQAGRGVGQRAQLHLGNDLHHRVTPMTLIMNRQSNGWSVGLQGNLSLRLTATNANGQPIGTVDFRVGISCDNSRHSQFVSIEYIGQINFNDISVVSPQFIDVFHEC